jgi:hypothetical protein
MARRDGLIDLIDGTKRWWLEEIDGEGMRGHKGWWIALERDGLL